MTIINLIVSKTKCFVHKSEMSEMSEKCLDSHRFRQDLGFVEISNGPVFMCLVCGVSS